MTIAEVISQEPSMSPEVFRGLLNSFMYNHAHFYQPPRTNAFMLDDKIYSPFDITGLQDNNDIQENYPLGFNQKLALRSIAPIVATDRVHGRKALPGENPDTLPLLSSGMSSVNILGNYRDWLRHNMPKGKAGDWQSIEEAIKKSGVKSVGDTYFHLILPGLSEETQRMLIRLGVNAYERDWGEKPDFVWLPEIAMDMTTLAALAKEGIKGTIALRRQIIPLNQVDTNAPAYWIRTKAGPVLVIVADNDISKEESFDHPDAGSFVYQGQAAGAKYQGKNFGRCGIFDGERFGEHWNDLYDPDESSKSSGAFEFMWWRDHHLTTLQENEEITRDIDFTKIPEAKLATEADGTNSWSCAHGIGRWEGKCSCDLDNMPSNWREYTQEEKQDLWSKMKKAISLIESSLDYLFPATTTGQLPIWRNRWNEWLLSQTENIATNKPVTTDGYNLSPVEKTLYIIYEALIVGDTSCGYYWGPDSYERQLPRNTLSILTNENVLKKILPNIPTSQRETFAQEWRNLTPRSSLDIKAKKGIISFEEAKRLKDKEKREEYQRRITR